MATSPLVRWERGRVHWWPRGTGVRVHVGRGAGGTLRISLDQRNTPSGQADPTHPPISPNFRWHLTSRSFTFLRIIRPTQQLCCEGSMTTHT